MSADKEIEPETEKTFKLCAESAPTLKAIIFENMLEEMPKVEALLQEPEIVYGSPVKVNYIELEQANKTFGQTCESIALEYERWRLVKAGKESLSDKIEWVSQTKGDGLGFATERPNRFASTSLFTEGPFRRRLSPHYVRSLSFNFSFLFSGLSLLISIMNSASLNSSTASCPTEISI